MPLPMGEGFISAFVDIGGRSAAAIGRFAPLLRVSMSRWPYLVDRRRGLAGNVVYSELHVRSAPRCKLEAVDDRDEINLGGEPLEAG